jgi:hypothetical protein
VSLELEKLRAQLADLQPSNAESNVVKETIRNMNDMLYREEMLWLQRCVPWLRGGDRNTKDSPNGTLMVVSIFIK